MAEIRKERLYYDESSLFEFEAKIIEQVEQEDGLWLVRLDRTAFYPTSGGQPYDTGWLNDSRVVDVMIKDNHVYHVVQTPCVAIEEFVNDKIVLGKIDVARRIDHMQQHAGQHILSACFEQLFDIDTVGFHLGEDLVTIDLDTSNLTKEVLQLVEDKANQIVFEDRKITPVFVSPEDLPELHLRHAPKVKEDIRIVQIEGFDNNPCGGTHPSSTGKISQIKLLKTEKMRNKVRLWFVCGNRALREHEKSQVVLQQLGKIFSTGREGLVEAVEKQFATFHEQKKLLAEFANKFSKLEGEALYAHSEQLNGNMLVCCSMVQNAVDEGYLKSVIKTYEAVAVHHGMSFIIGLVAPLRNRIFIQGACSGPVQLKANEWIGQVVSEFGGKGGGNGALAQGSIPIPAQTANRYEAADKYSYELIEKVLQCLKSAIVRE